MKKYIVMVATVAILCSGELYAESSKQKQLELFDLYNMYQKGSGNDDGATAMFLEKKERYYDVLFELLNTSEPGSFEEDVAFLFSEMAMVSNQKIKDKIIEISKSHPIEEKRCFWVDVLGGRYQTVPVDGFDDSTIKVYRVVDTGSSCIRNP